MAKRERTPSLAISFGCFVLVISLLSCDPVHTEYKTVPIDNFKADIDVSIAACRWKDMALIYTSGDFRSNLSRWVQTEGAEPEEGKREHMKSVISHTLERQVWVNGKKQSSTRVVYPPGKLALVIDGKTVGEYLPDQVAEDTISFRIIYACKERR
jgi:hypothetical protein